MSIEAAIASENALVPLVPEDMQATSPIEFTRMLPGQTLCKELLQDE
jgi:hypothetical protein